MHCENEIKEEKRGQGEKTVKDLQGLELSFNPLPSTVGIWEYGN